LWDTVYNTLNTEQMSFEYLLQVAVSSSQLLPQSSWPSQIQPWGIRRREGDAPSHFTWAPGHGWLAEYTKYQHFLQYFSTGLRNHVV